MDKVIASKTSVFSAYGQLHYYYEILTRCSNFRYFKTLLDFRPLVVERSTRRKRKSNKSIWPMLHPPSRAKDLILKFTAWKALGEKQALPMQIEQEVCA